MNPREILLSTAAIFLLAGLILGFQPRQVQGEFSSTSCGSVFRPAENVDALDGITGEGTPAECDSTLGAMKTLSFGGLGLAGVAFIAAFVAPNPSRRTGEAVN